MTDDPFEEIVAEEELLAELLEVAIAVWEAVPLLVWILLAIGILKIIGDFFSRESDRTTSTSTEEGGTRGSMTDGPKRERYSIHEDVADASRDYREPSESDPIVTPNEVDRGILGTIRRLIRMLHGRSREGS